MMRPLFNSQFGYCPLIWVFYGRMANNKINKLHERCLRIICKHKYLGQEELLEKDESVLLHHRNFKVAKDTSPEIMKECFQFYSQNNIKLREAHTFYSIDINSVYYDENSFAFLVPVVLELVPIEIRSSNAPKSLGTY